MERLQKHPQEAVVNVEPRLTRERQARRERNPFEPRRSFALLIAVPLLQKPILFDQTLLHRIHLTFLFSLLYLGFQVLQKFTDLGVQFRSTLGRQLSESEESDTDTTGMEQSFTLLRELKVFG